MCGGRKRGQGIKCFKFIKCPKNKRFKCMKGGKGVISAWLFSFLCRWTNSKSYLTRFSDRSFNIYEDCPLFTLFSPQNQTRQLTILQGRMQETWTQVQHYVSPVFLFMQFFSFIIKIHIIWFQNRKKKC